MLSIQVGQQTEILQQVHSQWRVCHSILSLLWNDKTSSYIIQLHVIWIGSQKVLLFIGSRISMLVVPKSPWGSVFERLSQYASPRFILLIINSTYHKSHKVITSLCIVYNRSMFGTLASMNGELTLYYSHHQLNTSTSLTVYNYAVIPWRGIWSKF